MADLPVEIVTGDIPLEIYEVIKSQEAVALDIETTGLDWHSDEIGSVQIYCIGQPVIIIRVNGNKPKRLTEIVENQNIAKVFHYAIFDLCFMYAKWGVRGKNIMCTKTASRLLDPSNHEKHSLRDLTQRYLGIELNKDSQTSNWLSSELTETQIEYAMKDVLYLHDLLKKLCVELERKGLWNIAVECFRHIPTRVFLDVNGYPDIYLHNHNQSEAAYR